MSNSILEKLKESAQSVLPVSIIVLLLHFTFAPLSTWTLVTFLVGAVLLVIGMSLFTMGADMAIGPMGEIIGSELTKTRKLPLIIISCFLLGVVVTIAEPDLQVLTRQVPAVPDLVLVIAVAVGVGLFLVLALLRILFQLSLSVMFIISYIVVFAVAAFTAPDFLAVGFDAGGVTTGPITVPFILALGAGISAVRGSKNAEQDSFGMCALCSIGPVLTVLIMGMFYDATESGYAYETPAAIESLGGVFGAYGHELGTSFVEVLTVLIPVVLIFALFQLVKRQVPRGQLLRIGIGLAYTLVGLTIFLTGVNLGFLPVGTYVGKHMAQSSYQWVLVPLSAVIGFFVVYAEPAVHVLNRQVEDITGGTITRRMMMIGISVGVSIALVLSVVRILSGLSIWFFLLPGYTIALVLTFFTPKIFTAIAFDSGGVASGTMTAAFLLPFAVGICEAVGGNIMTDAFGIVAMVAMMPLISMQLLGVMYNIRLKRTRAQELAEEMHDAEDIPEALRKSDLDLDAYVAEYGAVAENPEFSMEAPDTAERMEYKEPSPTEQAGTTDEKEAE